MKRKLLATSLAGLILVTSILTVACAPNIGMLKGDIDAFGPLIAYEIQLHHLSGALADKLTADGKLLIDDFGELASAWSGNKAVAIVTFSGQLLPIAADFATIPHLQEAMLILGTLTAIIKAYYNKTAPQLAPGASPVPVPKNDGELRDFLKRQRAALKAVVERR